MKSKMKKITACIVVAAMVFTLGNQSIFTVFAEEDDPVDAVYEIETDEGTDESAAAEEAAAEMVSVETVPEETAAEETALEEPGTVDAESSAEAGVPDASETDADTAEEGLLDEEDEEDEAEIDLLAVTDVPEAEGDADVYIDYARVALSASGTSPWDADNEDGHDTDASNDIIRSFDKASYAFTIGINSADTSKTYKHARVWVEVTLMGSDIENAFNTSAGAINLDYYDIVENGDSRTLTGYFNVDGDSVVPSEQSNIAFGVQVLAMDNGKVLLPKGSTWVEELDDDGVTTNKTSEPVALTFPALTVTAALHLNTKLTLNTTSGTGEGTFDFDGSDEDYLNYGLGKVEGRINSSSIILQMYDETGTHGMKGQALPTGDISFSVTLSSTYTPDSESAVSLDTYNDGAYRTLFYSLCKHGTSSEIELDGRKLTSTEGYSPGSKVTGGPYSYPVNSSSLYYNAVEESGTWIPASQVMDENGTSITIQVSGYEITKLAFPWCNAGGSVDSRTYYDDGVEVQDITQACFSVGGLWFMQPYTYTDDSGATHRIDDDLGQGTFTITEQTGVMDTSAGGTGTYGAAGTYIDAQYTTYVAETDSDGKIVTDEDGNVVYAYSYTKENTTSVYSGDDSGVETVALAPEPEFYNRISYANDAGNDYDVQGSSHFMQGTSYATLGWDDIRVRARPTYTANSQAMRQAAFNIVTKFDGAALEPDFDNPYKQNSNYGSDTYFGYKADGTNWTSDEEMQAADEDDLIWTKERKTDGSICVAVLFESRIPCDATTVQYTDQFVNLHVKTDPSLIGNVYMTCMVTRLWTVSDIVNAYNEEYPGDPITVDMLTKADGRQYVDEVLPTADNDYYTSESGGVLTVNHSTETLLVQSQGYGNDGEYYCAEEGNAYTKKVYNADGTVSGHSGSNRYGDSLLIYGYTTEVGKAIAQEAEVLDASGYVTGYEEKDTYHLDRLERIADYEIDVTMDVCDGVTLTKETGGTFTTTVYLTDTIPAGENYTPDSGYVGLVNESGGFDITYTQSSPLGQQGTITEGITVTQVTSEDGLQDTSYPAAVYIESDADGTQTLHFVIRDVPVVAGVSAKLYYSTTLGDESNDANDLSDGDTLTNTVTIQTDEDKR